MKKIIIFWKTFFIMVWEVARTMKTLRGLLSLFISYMIFHGWAVLFFVIGTISGNGWLIAIGSAVIIFWFGPGTPVIPLILIVALIIQRYIFFESTHQISIKEKWVELNQKYEDKHK
ncbi:hypothetical protein BK011_06515 [Tenericutes bacterium MZ-XQ]|jgi:hypothetical protein|nr:hypothetical protein BK011_06515 [Tenericutes bacterium MZ-XQ]